MQMFCLSCCAVPCLRAGLLDSERGICVCGDGLCLAEMGHDINPNVVKFNFAPVSSRDEMVYGSQRPGFLPGGVNEKPGEVEDSLVTEWCESMREKVRANDNWKVS